MASKFKKKSKKYFPLIKGVAVFALGRAAIVWPPSAPITLPLMAILMATGNKK